MMVADTVQYPPSATFCSAVDTLDALQVRSTVSAPPPKKDAVNVVPAPVIAWVRLRTMSVGTSDSVIAASYPLPVPYGYCVPARVLMTVSLRVTWDTVQAVRYLL